MKTYQLLAKWSSSILGHVLYAEAIYLAEDLDSVFFMIFGTRMEHAGQDNRSPTIAVLSETQINLSNCVRGNFRQEPPSKIFFERITEEQYNNAIAASRKALEPKPPRRLEL